MDSIAERLQKNKTLSIIKTLSNTIKLEKQICLYNKNIITHSLFAAKHENKTSKQKHG